jgi:Fe-S-cluster-containing hydrogenase components 1
MSKAILYDATLCIGCKQCEEACARENKLPYDEAVAKEEKTSDHKFTTVMSLPGDKYMRKLCMHCADPSCASVCPVGALEKTKAGPVVYDEGKCMGCRYCMVACPFSIPKYEWTKQIPRVRKCEMCKERTLTGGITACTEACPTGATMFGELDEMYALAQQRLRENPENYVKQIYGAQQGGGTSVLLLSSIPFEKFGYKSNLPNESLPALTFRVLSHIPDVVSLGFVLLGGIYWITNRREDVALAEGRQAAKPNGDKKTRGQS